jgi:uncharacterized protein (UPF0332 family)
MTFDWNEFFTLAEELRLRETEAAKRTAISRVYYAIYWRARNLLESEGFVYRQDDKSHQQIWQEYKQRGRTHGAVGRFAIFLRDNRTQADYFSEIEDISGLTEDSFELAEKIISYLQQIEKKTLN